MPTWVWYAIGVLAFVLAIYYLRNRQTTVQASIPDTATVNDQNGAMNAAAQILGTQATELSHLGAGSQTPQNVPSKVS